MKVLILSTYDINGGAAIAAYRLLQALTKNGIEAKMLVAIKQTDSTKIVEAPSILGNKMQKVHLALEKAHFYFHEKNAEVRFQFSTARSGYSVADHPEVLKADIIHIHWALQGFLSLSELKKLQQLNKKIIWTMHDMWAFTGGCHYSGSCTNYKNSCGYCPFLKHPSVNDISAKILKEKQEIYQDLNFVTCSKWLSDLAKQSTLLKNLPVSAIPNPIDINFYQPTKDQKLLRKKLQLDVDKRYLLFGASSLSDERKGLKFFLDTMKLYQQNHTDLPTIIIYGSQQHDVYLDGYEILHTGFLNQEQLKQYYQASDIYVISSIEDNLPNTVMEAIACGLPVLSFATGGIPEMVQHQSTGYIAEYQSVQDLAKGLDYLLNQVDLASFSTKSRQYCLDNFSEKNVAERHISAYLQLLQKS